MVSDTLHMSVNSRAHKDTLAIHTKGGTLETCAVLEVWYPHSLGISLPLGAMGLRTLHIGFEQEHAGVGLGTVVGECKIPCRLK